MLLENTPNHGEKLSPNCLKEMEHHAELVSQDVRNDYRLVTLFGGLNYLIWGSALAYEGYRIAL